MTDKLREETLYRKVMAHEGYAYEPVDLEALTAQVRKETLEGYRQTIRTNAPDFYGEYVDYLLELEEVYLNSLSPTQSKGESKPKLHVGQYRQLFREMPKGATFTSEELADLFERTVPLDPEGKLDIIAGDIYRRAIEKLKSKGGGESVSSTQSKEEGGKG